MVSKYTMEDLWSSSIGICLLQEDVMRLNNACGCLKVPEQVKIVVQFCWMVSGQILQVIILPRPRTFTLNTYISPYVKRPCCEISVGVWSAVSIFWVLVSMPVPGFEFTMSLQWGSCIKRHGWVKTAVHVCPWAFSHQITPVLKTITDATHSYDEY